MAIFKLAGGKGRMLKVYEPFFDNLSSTKIFVDYFGGTGAVSVWFKKMYPNTHIILNELSTEIHGIHKALLNDSLEFYKVLRAYDDSYKALRDMYPHHARNGPKSDVYRARKQLYLELRERYADTDDFYTDTEKYATLYFLLQTNFNGVWQCRAEDGIYYTPFGNGTQKGSVIRWVELEEFRTCLKYATISNLDYIDVLVSNPNAVHYFDPPYVESYTKFSDDFDENHTKHLCDRICHVHYRGEKVFFSNKRHVMFEKRLTPLKFEEIMVQYTAGRNNKSEGTRSVEILAHNNFKE